MIYWHKPTPHASWHIALVFLVALGLVPGLPGFEHVRDALLSSFDPRTDARRADPENWPVNADFVPAVVARAPVRELARAVRLRLLDISSFVLVARVFCVAPLPDLLFVRTLVTAPHVLQVLGLGSQCSLRGPPR